MYFVLAFNYIFGIITFMCMLFYLGQYLFDVFINHIAMRHVTKLTDSLEIRPEKNSVICMYGIFLWSIWL